MSAFLKASAGMMLRFVEQKATQFTWNVRSEQQAYACFTKFSKNCFQERI